MGSSSAKLKNVDTEADHGADEEKKLMEKEKEFSDKLGKIEESLKSHNSEGNVLKQFDQLLRLRGSSLDGIQSVVSSLEKHWNGIDNNLDALKRYIDEKEINELKDMKIEYYSLLLKTGSVVEVLCHTSSILRRHIRHMKKSKSRDEFKQSMEILTGKWLKNDELENLSKDWESMVKRLQFQKFKKVLSIVGGVVVVGGLIAASIVIIGGSYGTAAPALVATVKICGAHIGTSYLIGGGLTAICGAAAGVLIAKGGAFAIDKIYIPSPKNIEKMHEISTMIKNMSATGLAIKKQISNLKTYQKEVKTEIDYVTDDTIQEALEEIDQFLIKYKQQGAEIVEKIEEQFKQYIK